tara:strand:+ start:98726 stop:103180 length:4455 start_codon:yes stop_codon:yes gene_type:complete
MGMLSKYTLDSVSSTNFNTYVLFPRKANFVAPPTLPVEVDGVKSFTFVWSEVAYDRKNPTYTCSVTLVVSLDTEENSMDMQLQVDADQSYTSHDLNLLNSDAVQYLGMPTLIFKKDESESVNDGSFITNSSGYGYTYLNPFKYLRRPRYSAEAIQFSHLGERCISAGQPSAPLPALFKYNYGSPGGFSIPAMVYGNRDTREGTLIYGLDTEGTNPKAFQFYLDDANLFIKTAHISDHAYDPYGVGGYTTTDEGHGLPYSLQNKPTWSLRIHPFKSTTKWADWYGYGLYRDTVIDKQEAYGWLPPSFYDRYQAGEISKSAAEVPMILNTFGFTTGDMSTLSVAADYYRYVYTNAINPGHTEPPIIPIHYQCAELNFDTNRRTGEADPAATYNGWEPWAGHGTGVDHFGPEAYKAPDYTGLNANSSGTFYDLSSTGHLPYSYNIYPFTISSGSVWTQEYSGIDLIGKAINESKITLTNDRYKQWAYEGQAPGIFGGGFSSCYVPQVCKDKNMLIGETLGAQGMNAYHDTLGAYGRGCTAESHIYYDPITKKDVILTHPRGDFSRYYNRKQVEWSDEWTQATTSGFRSTFGSDSNSVETRDWKMGQSAEFPVDLNLKNAPIALIYEPVGPIFDAYVHDITNPRTDVTSTPLIDNLSDESIASGVAFGITSYACHIEPPNWLQRCPIAKIALNDRMTQNEWHAVYASNASPFFFTRAESTGVGAYGQQFYTTGTDEIQAMDWASFALTQWPYSNNLSVWHVSNQYGFIAPAYSGVVNDENEVFQSGVWSGYAEDLLTRMIRIQAYNPDFIHHGDMLYPLDEYTVDRSTENSNTNGFLHSQHPNNEDIDSLVTGDEKVTHFVRRHRENGNLLVAIGNWFSGSASFQATFEPDKYGITNGYQVYSLDVNTVNHGTKTLDSIVEAETDFDINLTLDEWEFKVYEIEINQNTLDNEVFSDLRTDYSPVAYGYSVQAISTDSLSLAYSYGTTTLGDLEEPQEGFKAAATQDILNNVPQWMRMRQDTESDGWKLTNSWGMALERVLENSETNTNNLNIITAQTYPLSKVNHIDIDSASLVEPKAPRNLLFNSSFSMKDVARSLMPAGWEKHDLSQSTELVSKSTGVTCCSLVAPDGKLKAGQEIVMGNVMLGKLYASVYILCDAPSTDITLHVSVEGTDATNHSSHAKITSRSSEWVRLVLPIEVNSQVYRINFSVTANCSDKISISAPQLEIGALTAWTKSETDTLPYLPYPSLFNLVYSYSTELNSKKIPIFPISSEQEFIESSIPTRIEKAPAPTKDINAYSSAAFGRRVDQLGEVTRTEFAIVGDKIVERAISPTPFDVYGSYDIRDLRFYEEIRYGTREDSRVTLEPLVAAVRKDILFVVCRETFNGLSKYIVKTINPRVPPNGEDYLESMVDFDLDLDLSKTFSIGSQINEDVFSVSFSDVEPNYMIVTTTNNISYYYKLCFDYYYFNNSKNRLYLIESYPEANITVI